MKKILTLSATVSLIATTAFANPNTGCGLGSQIIKNQDSVLMQIFAATTNGTSGNQTFGITSGSSGCAKPAKFVSNERTNEFVAGNMELLALDISSGHGESLKTLATLLKVDDVDAFSKKLQNNFNKIYTSQNISSAELIDNIIALG